MQIINNEVKYFTGVVEDRQDPLKQGRVRVRVYGLHPYQKTPGAFNGIPTSDLLWMDVLQPIHSASISGVGHSPTGIVEGTSVYGHFLDRYSTVGLVLGTYGANRAALPNYTEGFSDPTGQYPRAVGSDTNPLAQGGSVGLNYTPNLIQNSNIVVGMNPSDEDLSNIPEDPDPAYTIQQMIRHDEGLRLKVYFDQNGYPTVGIGHLIIGQAVSDMDVINKILSNQVGRTVTGNPGSITMDEASTLFTQDLAVVQQAVLTNSIVAPVYKKLNRSRQMAIENMTFQMGIGGVAGFTKALGYMYNADWKNAYNELRDSQWYYQTTGRAAAVSYCILVGNMSAYGVMPPTTTAKSVGAAAVTSSIANDDPSDPYTPTDTRILFTEPDSSYQGQYPYVNAYESESGHIQEFDDTPGYERYRLIHPAGPLIEVQPDGTRIIKSKSLYFLSDDANVAVNGNNKVNVRGDEVYYIMGSERHQVDGNEIIYIRGNETKTVEGNGTLLVQGNINIVVQGQAQIHIEQEASITIDKDATIQCNQNADINVVEKTTLTTANMDLNVTDTFNITATDINLNASNNTTIDSGATSTVSGGNVKVG